MVSASAGLVNCRPPTSAVSAVMRGNRKWDTKPEKAVRSALHAAGLRFRKHYPISVETRGGALVVRPDVVFTGKRVAVFIDGCFWHSCPVHGRMPTSNRDYWQPKLERNVARDRQVDAALARSGWAVVRVWEHEATEEALLRIQPLLDRVQRGA